MVIIFSFLILLFIMVSNSEILDNHHILMKILEINISNPGLIMVYPFHFDNISIAYFKANIC